jgi:hypothetical protein
VAALPAPSALNQIWVADITDIPTEEGWLYLAGVMESFWSTLKQELVY